MRLLVLGASGQLAQALAGVDAVCLGRNRVDLAGQGAEGALAQALDDHRPDAVINAAAFTDVDGAEDSEAGEKLTAVNATAPGIAARLAADRGLPVVHVSTDFVFDGSGGTPWRPEDRVAPLSAYGRSKAAGEAAVRAAGGVAVILRTAWVFAPGAANFVTAILRHGAARDSLRVVGDEVGGPTPAADLARACRVIAARLTEAPELAGTYHFTGAPDLSRAEFARAILARAGLATRVEEIASSDWGASAPRPLNSRLDCRATGAAFGLTPPDWGPELDRAVAAWQEAS